MHSRTMMAGLVLTILLISCAPQQTGKETVKIGVILPLTGGEATLGQNTKAGIDLAFDEISKKDTRYAYQLVYEDDQLDNKLTATAYHKLKDSDGVSAIIGVSSGSGHVIAPLAEEQKTISCIVAASDPKVVEGRKYVFKHWVTPQEEAKKYVVEAKQQGWKRIAVIEANQQGILEMANAAQAEGASAGVTLDRIQVDPGMQDFRTVLLGLKDNPPDAFMLLLFPSQMIPAVQQLREIGFDQNLSSIEMFEFVPERLDLLEGQWYVSAAKPSQAFTQEYERKYGKEPVAPAPHGYDCLNLIVKGFEEGGTDPDAAMAAIRTLHGYDGAAGTLSFNNGSIESPAGRLVVSGGKFVPAG